MNLDRTKLIYGALSLVSVLLTACGGGGGDTPPAATYTIGGTISGLSGTVVLQNNGGDNLSVSANGSFTFKTAIATGSAYNVTVQMQPAGKTCTASSNTGTVSGANVTSVSVTCSMNSYTIGGSISGLTGTVVLQNNGGDNLPLSVNGTFTFPNAVASGAGYAVTVLTPPAGQRCTVTNGSGSNVTAHVNTVTVSCVNVYTISANVAGLGTSIGLILQNTGSVTGTDNLSVTTDGPATFSKALATGETYGVKVLIQPAAPALTCTVAGGAGAMGASAVTVNVTCATPIPQFAYVANYNSNDVSAYTVTNGVLAQVSCGGVGVAGCDGSSGTNFVAGTGPTSVTVTPSGKFAYVANFGIGLGSGDVSAFTINPGTGALTQVLCGGGAGCNADNFLAGSNPQAVTVDPSGQFAYVVNLNSADISAYAINQTTGALTKVPCGGGAGCNGDNFQTSANPTANPSTVVVEHAGRYAYVANANDDSVSAYTINPVSGALTRVLCGGGPICDTVTDPNNFLTGFGPQSMDIDPTSRFAYVANANENSVSAYAIDAATGSLTPIDANPGTAGVIDNFPAGTTPTSVAVDPHGKYVYVANKGSGDISAYSIDNAAGGTGALTAILSGPFAAGTGPTSITVDLSGQYVYVANWGLNAQSPPYYISVYSIDNIPVTGTGALTPLGGGPFVAGTNPASVVTTVLY